MHPEMHPSGRAFGVRLGASGTHTLGHECEHPSIERNPFCTCSGRQLRMRGFQKVLIDNGKEFADRLFARWARKLSGRHQLDLLCQTMGIEHRLTKRNT